MAARNVLIEHPDEQPNTVYFHTDFVLVRGKYAVTAGDTPGVSADLKEEISQFLTLVAAVDGVEKMIISQHQLSIYKYAAYPWEAIEDQVAQNLERFYGKEIGRIQYREGRSFNQSRPKAFRR